MTSSAKNGMRVYSEGFYQSLPLYGTSHNEEETNTPLTKPRSSRYWTGCDPSAGTRRRGWSPHGRLKKKSMVWRRVEVAANTKSPSITHVLPCCKRWRQAEHCDSFFPMTLNTPHNSHPKVRSVWCNTLLTGKRVCEVSHTQAYDKNKFHYL